MTFREYRERILPLPPGANEVAEVFLQGFAEPTAGEILGVPMLLTTCCSSGTARSSVPLYRERALEIQADIAAMPSPLDVARLLEGRLEEWAKPAA